MIHSGLGTSSILLGGVIMAALWRAVGQKHSPDSLIDSCICCKILYQCYCHGIMVLSWYNGIRLTLLDRSILLSSPIKSSGYSGPIMFYI